MEQLSLPFQEALNFLHSLRNAYIRGSIIHPNYLTFYISSKVFTKFLESFKYRDYRLCPGEPPRYMFREVMVKEDRSLVGLESRVVEGKNNWDLQSQA